MADEATKSTDQVSAVNVQGSSSADINVTMEQAKQAAPAAGPTAESLNVSQEQFDKFYSADKGYNWEAHARELQFQNEQRANRDTDQKADAKPAEPKGEADKTGDENAIDWNGLGAKIGDGTFGEADKQQLMGIGIPENIVDEYVNVIKMNVEMHFQNVAQAFGGEQRMDQVINAAKAQMTEQEFENAEKMLADPNQYRVAADSMMARAGAQPIGGPNANHGGAQDAPQPYANQQEMLADQRNPKYRADPAFREQVWRRASVSNFDNANHTL